MQEHHQAVGASTQARQPPMYQEPSPQEVLVWITSEKISSATSQARKVHRKYRKAGDDMPRIVSCLNRALPRVARYARQIEQGEIEYELPLLPPHGARMRVSARHLRRFVVPTRNELIQTVRNKKLRMRSSKLSQVENAEDEQPFPLDGPDQAASRMLACGGIATWCFRFLCCVRVL
ncbi:uncharacterized protein BKA78DRAFT_343974 [Phyllosticta capitalensis]|uniref:uncharacterized protein n=1 Tax=Phyllosticta capitalensis TaxID=121624 RepID=UPI00312D1F7C